MHRLMAKWETIKTYVPGPEICLCGQYTDTAVLYFGTSEASTLEAVDRLGNEGMPLNGMRIKAFPFNKEVHDFIQSHNRVFVIEQNRDSQLRTLLMAEFEFGPDKLKSVLCFDGTPISARNIRKQILLHMPKNSVTPLPRPQTAGSQRGEK